MKPEPPAAMPAEAGIQEKQEVLDFRSRSSPGQASFSGSDEQKKLLRKGQLYIEKRLEIWYG